MEEQIDEEDNAVWFVLCNGESTVRMNGQGRTDPIRNPGNGLTDVNPKRKPPTWQRVLLLAPGGTTCPHALGLASWTEAVVCEGIMELVELPCGHKIRDHAGFRAVSEAATQRHCLSRICDRAVQSQLRTVSGGQL